MSQVKNVSQLVKFVREHVVGVDTVGRNKAGHVVVRREYFYRHGQTAEGFAEKVCKDLEDRGVVVTVVDQGDHFAAFRGGASVRASSHFWAELELVDEGAATEAGYDKLAGGWIG